MGDSAATNYSSELDAPLPPDKSADMDFQDARTGRKRTIPRLLGTSSAKFSKSTETIAAAETSNHYDLLSDEEESHRIPMPPLTPIPRPRSSVSLPQPSVSTQPPATRDEAAPNSKRERVPTITIKWDITRVREEIRLANIKSTDFLLKQIRDGTVVKLPTLKIYELFLKRCIDRQIPHFTHAVDASKPLRIVLLGLPNMSIDNVKEALSEFNVTPEDVKQMRVRNLRFLEHNNFILYFRKGSISIGALREIKAINNVLVKWTYYDAKRHGPTQCRRCQAWGHGSSNCHLPPACVKCAGSHETSKCTASAKGEKVPTDQLKCVNCQESHAASYGGCACRQSYIASRPKRQAPSSHRNRGGRPGFNRKPAPSPGDLRDPKQYPPPSPEQQQQQHPRQQYGASYSNALTSKTNNSYTTNHSNNSNNNSNNNSQNQSVDDSYSVQEVFGIYNNLVKIANSGKSRSEQFEMILSFAMKNGTTVSRRP